MGCVSMYADCAGAGAGRVLWMTGDRRQPSGWSFEFACWALLGAVLLAGPACGGGRPLPSSTQPDGSVAGAQRDDAGPRPSDPDAGTAGADGNGAAGDADAAVPGTGGDGRPPIFEPADPTLTRLLVPSPAALVGNGTTACTNGIPSRADTWCAFSRLEPGSGAELWVFNFTEVAAGASLVCDGTSPSCLRLTTQLWTGSSLDGPSHPYANRFDGDTLIFHAGTTTPTRNPYDGPVWAWRPGWPEARQLTSDHGLRCQGSRQTPTIHCVDAAEVVETGTFLPPFKIRSFDLRAGRLGDAAPTGPLPMVERVAATGAGDLLWQAGFSLRGDWFVYSVATVRSGTSVVKRVAVDGSGIGAPAVVVEDGFDWEISHDGARLYHRQGVDLGAGVFAIGRLATVDLVSGSGLAVLADEVVHYELLGAHDDVVTDRDHGLLVTQEDAQGKTAVSLLRDPSRPEELLRFPPGAYAAEVATDLRHSLYYEDGPNGLPHIYVMRNDGSGRCSPKRSSRSETYGGHFSHTSRLVFWIEYGGDSEEGWYASPETCGDPQKFGDYVTGFFPVGDDFVVFEGTDSQDSAYHLQYARLATDRTAPRTLPKLIERDVDDSVAAITRDGATHVLYAVSRDDAQTRGVFLHGPLPR